MGSVEHTLVLLSFSFAQGMGCCCWWCLSPKRMCTTIKVQRWWSWRRWHYNKKNLYKVGLFHSSNRSFYSPLRSAQQQSTQMVNRQRRWWRFSPEPGPTTFLILEQYRAPPPISSLDIWRCWRRLMADLHNCCCGYLLHNTAFRIIIIGDHTTHYIYIRSIILSSSPVTIYYRCVVAICWVKVQFICRYNSTFVFCWFWILIRCKIIRVNNITIKGAGDKLVANRSTSLLHSSSTSISKAHRLIGYGMLTIWNRIICDVSQSADDH